MSRKPVILYSLASFGMGHATRAVPMIERLKNDYEIHIFTSRNAKIWLSKRYPHIHDNLTLTGVTFQGRINPRLSAIKAWLNLPLTALYILNILIFILIKRPVAVYLDFEFHAGVAARIANYFYDLPIITCDNFTSILYSEVPFELTQEETKAHARWKKNIRMITNSADHFLVHKYLETKLSHPNAEYVPIPVRDEILEASRDITYDGAIVVSTGSLLNSDLLEVLKQTPFQYLFFGHIGEFEDGNIQFKNFSDQDYLQALKEAPFVLVSGNSSAIDALAMNKPIINIPHPGHFEQYFCGRVYQYLGVGLLAENLMPEQVETFHSNLESYIESIQKLEYFDNEYLLSRVKKHLKL